MSDSESAFIALVGSHSASHVSTSVNHPRLYRVNPKTIRVFLSLYDQYEKEVYERAAQITNVSAVTTEAVRPVSLKYCVDPEYLESLIAFKRIKDVTSEEDRTDQKLRGYLDTKAQDSDVTVNLSSLDKIVSAELKMDMTNPDAVSRMENLFSLYREVLRQNGVAWISEENQKIAVGHVLSAIRPHAFQERLREDLEFSRARLKKDFTGIFDHALDISDAWKKVEMIPKHVTRKFPSATFSNRGGSKPPVKEEKKFEKNQKIGKTRTPPICLNPPCKAKGKRHWLDDCTDCTADEKLRIRKEHAAEKARDGPSKSTRAQNAASFFKSEDNKKERGTAGRLNGSSRAVP